MSGILQLINTFPSGGFAVKNSLRFRSSASAYLSRTPASASNRRTWTFSAWIKRGSLGSAQYLLLGKTADSGSAGTVVTTIGFTASDTLEIYSYTYGTGVIMDLVTTQVFRDPSAWYHIEIAIDTTQATASNRAKASVNGVQVTSFSASTYPAQNSDLGVNYNFAQRIGTYVDSVGAYSLYFDGYMAEVNFIDGQALTPSSFGAFDATSGVWQATRYSGTYGTNGFYLKFSDTTSTTTLCYDYSGNSNNWTPNNISLTAGSTYDSMLDSPTNYDNGGNGVGNYAVLNPIAGSATTYSNGNLNASGQSSVGTFWVATGKWYWEAVVTSGITGNTLSDSWAELGIYDGIAGNGFGYISNGEKENGGRSAFGATWTNGDTIGIALDADAKSLTFYKNGTSQGSFTFSSTSTVGYTPWMTPRAAANNYAYWFNFGQRPFSYTPPTGYKALNTQNLSAPSIQNGSNFMAATLYTGTNATQSISNSNNSVSFQPDFVWIKNRANSGADHALVDSVRGAAYWLASNLTQAESNNTAMVTSINSNGFTVGASNMTNQSGVGLVGWQWKAGGTAVTNTAGSITSQVSANTTAGFSVVTATLNSSGIIPSTGHGLGKTPAMIVMKDRTNADNWYVYHQNSYSTPTQATLNLNTTSAINTTNGSSGGVDKWTVSSTILGAGNSAWTYTPNGQCVFYCFAAIPGYSAFGSYTGNGSADGPFVYCGFRPRYVLVKATNSAENWFTWDTSRDPYNVASNDLYPNLSNAESGGTPRIDFLSNGFKCRASAANPNLNGVTYIYAAFAENPFKYSLAR